MSTLPLKQILYFSLPRLKVKGLLGFLWKCSSMAALRGVLFPFASCLRGNQWGSTHRYIFFLPNAKQEELPCVRNSSTCVSTCSTKSTWTVRHPVGAPSGPSWEPSSCWNLYSLRYREKHSSAINLHPAVRSARHGCSKPGVLKSCPCGPNPAGFSVQPGRKTFHPGNLVGQNSWLGYGPRGLDFGTPPNPYP